MTLSYRFWPALGWNFLASILAGLISVPIAALVFFAMLAISGDSTGAGTFVTGFLVTLAVFVVVNYYFYQRFVRKFFAEKIGLVLGAKDVIIVALVVGLIGGAVGGLLPLIGPFISFAIGLAGLPWWFTRDDPTSAPGTSAPAAPSAMAAPPAAPPAMPAPAAAPAAAPVAPGVAGPLGGVAPSAWATWLMQISTQGNALDTAIAGAQASGSWDDAILARNAVAAQMAAMPSGEAPIEVTRQAHAASRAMQAITTAGTSVDLARTAEAFRALRADWEDDATLRQFVATYR